MKLRNKKTGKIGDFLCVIQDDDIKLWSITNCYETYHYKTLSEFNNDWENYEPVEPLIKDEKIRKVVIAWAEVNNLSSVLYNKDEDCVYSPYGSDDNDLSISISFDEFGVFKGLEHKKEYTIEELCGDEE